MKRNVIILIIILILTSGCINNEKVIEAKINYSYNTETYDGYLIIPVIDMKLGFYNIGNSLNDLSKNIEQIETGLENSYLFAAHSGTGKLAYFNDLRKLKVNDEITLEFRNKTKNYKVVNIRREEKNGSIHIKNEEDQLILTTCDQIVKGYQLIIEAKEI